MICDAFRPWMTPEERNRPDPIQRDLDRLAAQLAQTQTKLQEALDALRNSR